MEQGAVGWDAGDYYAEANFNDRPKNDRLAICVRFEVLDGKDADDLDDGDEEAESEDGQEGGFLAALEAEGDQDGEGEGDDDAVEGETCSCECVVRCNGIDAAALNRHIPLPGDRATGKTQHERKSQLVTDTGDDDGDDDGAVGLDEPADTEVRGQKRDFEA